MTAVVVTGASGFLGRHVAGSLLQRGHEVHGFTRASREPLTGGVVWHRVDLRDRASVAAALAAARPQGLVHLAWNTTPRDYWEAPDNLDWVAASLGLFREFAAAGGRRIVAAGTSAEYDWGAPPPMTEGVTVLNPRGLYGRCKNALREILEGWAPRNGVTWAWGRIFDLFGPGEAPGRLVARSIRALLDGAILEMDEARETRDFLYVKDAGDAFAALYCSAVQGPVNIASGEGVAVREMLERLALVLAAEGRIRFGARPASALAANLRASPARLRDEVGWHPSFVLDEALRETADAARRASE